MSTEGSLAFARYAYPPNELGYCGPAGASAMLSPNAAAEIDRRARQFEGAWAYLEFIAESCGLDDALDERVVEAYWIGNDLLEQCDPAALHRRLADRFKGQIGGTWRDASTRALAHHSFQVFEVYPWARLLATSGNPRALTVLEDCRIRTGYVVAVSGETATVESTPLTWDGFRLSLGTMRRDKVRWSAGGNSLLNGVRAGDTVALHWDWVCDVISADQVAQIELRESRQCAALAGDVVSWT